MIKIASTYLLHQMVSGIAGGEDTDANLPLSTGFTATREKAKYAKDMLL